MTEATQTRLFAAWAYCDEEDKSTEFMIQYMADSAEISTDEVMDFLTNPNTEELRTAWYERQRLILNLEQMGVYHKIKVIDGRGVCALQEFMFTIGIIYGLNELGYEGRYCYPKERMADAVLAYEIWDGKSDPPGPWIKHKGSVEYSNPELNDNSDISTTETTGE